MNPDLVIVSNIDFYELVVDAEAIRLVCEIASAATAAVDEMVKTLYYATAGIPWYLLVDQETCTLRLYQLVGTAYVEHSITAPGEILRLTDPIDVVIDPADLRRRR